jgi:hypothetical protein
VAFATVITLLAVPALYLIREDLIGLGQRAGRAVRVAAEPGVHP